MEQRENKMGYMPMGKLLVGMAWPIMLSMLVQALYNVVGNEGKVAVGRATGGEIF